MLNLPIESIIAFFFSAVFIFTAVFLLSYLIIDKFLLSKRKKIEKELIKQEAYKKAVGALEDARVKSINIVGLANVKAKRILSESEVLSDQTKRVLEEELRKILQKQQASLESVSSGFVKAFEQALEDEKNKSLESISQTKDTSIQTISQAKESSIETISQTKDSSVAAIDEAKAKSASVIAEVSATMKDQLLSSVAAIKTRLESETVESGKELQQKISEDYMKLKEELDDYKGRRYREIDQKIYEILVNVSREVLGHSMSMDEQEDLVMQSLDEAKKKSEFEL